jgi:uncharacterized phage-associated protein
MDPLQVSTFKIIDCLPNPMAFFGAIMTVGAGDVACYLLLNGFSMRLIKLHTLLYYAQSWSLVSLEKELFQNKIYAWETGPVISKFYPKHDFREMMLSVYGDHKLLSDSEKRLTCRIAFLYGCKMEEWLSDLSMIEDPWKKARIGLKHDERGSRVISNESMLEYYSKLHYIRKQIE